MDVVGDHCVLVTRTPAGHLVLIVFPLTHPKEAYTVQVCAGSAVRIVFNFFTSSVLFNKFVCYLSLYSLPSYFAEKFLKWLLLYIWRVFLKWGQQYRKWNIDYSYLRSSSGYFELTCSFPSNASTISWYLVLRCSWIHKVCDDWQGVSSCKINLGFKYQLSCLILGFNWRCSFFSLEQGKYTEG